MTKRIIPFIDLNHQKYQDTQQLNKSAVHPDFQWSFNQRGMDFNKNLALAGKYCHHPFNTITIDAKGEIYACICQAWLPISIGNIADVTDLASVFKTSTAQKIQSSIVDGSYRYCDHNSCSLIKNNELPIDLSDRLDTVNWINFALDPSCNLSCPSCRTDQIFMSSGDQFDRSIRLANHIASLISKFNHLLKFTLSSDGDPFASLVYRHLLMQLDLAKCPDIEIEITTNGQLLSQFWSKFSKIHKNIVRLKISLDAASEDTYNLVRRGGSWSKLMENIKFIKTWRDRENTAMVLTSNFVVQKNNYQEIPSYVELAQWLGFDEINLQKLDNWGTFKNFKEHAVHDKSNSDYENFINIISTVSLNNKVNLTNLVGINETK